MTSEFRDAILDGETRTLRTTKIDVIEAPSHTRSAVGLGMMVAVISRKETGMLSQLRASLEKGAIAPTEITKLLNKKPSGDLWTARREYVDTLLQQPVYAEIRYGGEPLHKGLFVPTDLDVVSTVFPYNGGRLAPGGFTLVEHLSGDSNSELEALIVRSAPALTEAEMAAIQNVPPDQLANNVGPASWCDTTFWAAAGYAIAVGFAAAAAVVTTTIAMEGKRASAWSRHLPDEEIERLGPAASARSLLALRRKLIDENGPSLAKEER